MDTMCWLLMQPNFIFALLNGVPEHKGCKHTHEYLVPFLDPILFTSIPYPPLWP